jgi:hypothetical protein
MVSIHSRDPSLDVNDGHPLPASAFDREHRCSLSITRKSNSIACACMNSTNNDLLSSSRTRELEENIFACVLSRATEKFSIARSRMRARLRER